MTAAILVLRSTPNTVTLRNSGLEVKAHEQGMESPGQGNAENDPRRCGCGKRHDGRNVQYQRKAAGRKLFSPRTVSYTHLDVYKRQEVGEIATQVGTTPAGWNAGKEETPEDAERKGLGLSLIHIYFPRPQPPQRLADQHNFLSRRAFCSVPAQTCGNVHFGGLSCRRDCA